MISRRDDDVPFYLQLAPVAVPHSSYTPEAKYADAAVPPQVITPAHTETDRSDKPQWVIRRTSSSSSITTTRRQMIRTLYSVDDQVDRLMLRLEALGELDDTLVIYTSDNGYMWGEHSLGSKFLPYTGSVAVPFLVRWPGPRPGGRGPREAGDPCRHRAADDSRRRRRDTEPRAVRRL